MKLVIVDRSKPETYARLKSRLQDQLNIKVVSQRRMTQRRTADNNQGPQRRSGDRRKFTKPFNGRDYIVIYISG